MNRIDRTAGKDVHKSGQSVAERMSKSSDQQVPQKAPGKPAMGRNIKELPEDELKQDVADKMSESGHKERPQKR